MAARPRMCNPSIEKIYVPNETVKAATNCFLRLPMGTVAVTDEVTSTPYELCCPSSCTKEGMHCSDRNFTINV